MEKRELSRKLAKAVDLVEKMDDDEVFETFINDVLNLTEAKDLKTAVSEFDSATRSMCELAIKTYGKLVVGSYGYDLRTAMRDIEIKLQGGE